MPIFVIFRVSDPQMMKAAIEAEFPQDSLAISANEWLVSFRGTAVGLSDKLGVSDGRNGVAIIFGMSSYFGRATTDIWDWIKAKAESSDG
jgi:hypothetical protein